MSKKDKNKVIEGLIETTRGGLGFLIREGKEDILVRGDDLKTALNGDRVKVKITKPSKNRKPEGKVLSIIERAQHEVVGTVIEKEGSFFLNADAGGIYTKIRLKSDQVKKDFKVKVRIIEWNEDQKYPLGKILEVFGKAGQHEAEIKSILSSQNIVADFPKPVETEAKKVREDANKKFDDYSPSKNRKDFRNVTTFTIDPEDAKDFDDALSVEKIDEDIFRIGIHIADVSEFVVEGSSLDREARERGFSVYLVDRTVPMLPPDISNDIASLNPNVDRFTFSAVFEITKNGQLKNEYFTKGIINSDKRFSYEEAQRVLNKKSESPFSKELESLNHMAKSLQKKNKKEGAIEFEQDEVKFVLNKNKKVVDIIKKERLETHKLVEEMMLLANRRVAHFISQKSKRDIPFIYRVHDEPDPNKIEELGIFLKAIGHGYKEMREGLTSKDVQKILENVKGSQVQGLVETSTLRAMSKASYSVENIGHFGLAFSHYTHFTSPIRRYADLVVHRILEKCISDKPIPKDLSEKLRAIAKETSKKEISAVKAERESIRFKQAEYMSGKIGQTFDAHVVGVMKYGLFVQTDKELAEGLIPISTLDGYYVVEKDRYILKEKGGKKSFRLGDRIKVKVAGTDVPKHQINFTTVD